MNAQKLECPFCLENNLIETPIIAESIEGYLTTAKSYGEYYLIVPRIHVEHISDLPDDWMHDFKQLLAAIPNLQDFNISLNIGKQAGQTIKHLHFWVVPRIDDRANGKGLATLIRLANEQ